MIRALKRAARALGFEVRRARSTSLPVIWECECDGVRFPFWVVNEHAAAWWMKSAVRFDAEMRFLKEAATPGSTVLEVGAHHGMHTMQLARWVGGAGSVHSFELNADNALALSANVGLNGYSNVRVRRAAVGAAGGTVAAEGERVVSGAGAVPVVTVDDYCAEQGIGTVDVLKIDVEGYEGHVLMGARRVLAEMPFVDLELHLDDLGRYASTPSEVLAMFDFDKYDVSMMVRPDWDRALLISAPENVPVSGVANLFFRPRKQLSETEPRQFAPRRPG